MQNDNLTTGLNALRALIKRDAVVDAGRELSSVTLLEIWPQILAVIEAAAELNEVLEEVDWRDGCERVNPQAIHAAQGSLDDALDALTPVLPTAK